MTIYNICKAKLENFPNFRERRFRGKYLAKLTLREMGIEDRYESKTDGGKLSYEELITFASKYDSFRHEYDRVQKDYPELRGEDYADGKILAQEKMLEFGYEPNHHENIKRLSNIS